MSFFDKVKSVAATANAKLADLREKQRQAELEAKERRKRFEEEREKTKQFEFWNCRGTAYKIQKETYQEGNYIYVKTKFHVDSSGKGSIRVIIPKCGPLEKPPPFRQIVIPSDMRDLAGADDAGTAWFL